LFYVERLAKRGPLLLYSEEMIMLSDRGWSYAFLSSGPFVTVCSQLEINRGWCIVIKGGYCLGLDAAENLK